MDAAAAGSSRGREHRAGHPSGVRRFDRVDVFLGQLCGMDGGGGVRGGLGFRFRVSRGRRELEDARRRPRSADRRSIVAHLAAREERNRRARRDRGAPRPPVPPPRRPSASCVSRRRSLSDSSGRATRRRAASPRRRRAATTRRRRRLRRSFRLDWFFFRPPWGRRRDRCAVRVRAAAPRALPRTSDPPPRALRSVRRARARPRVAPRAREGPRVVASPFDARPLRSRGLTGWSTNRRDR